MASVGSIRVSRNPKLDSQPASHLGENLLQAGHPDRETFLAEVALAGPESYLEWNISQILETPTNSVVKHVAELATWLFAVSERISPELNIRLIPDLKTIAARAPRLLEPLLNLPPSVHHSEGDRKFGWDSLVDPWVDSMPQIGDKIPSAYRIWQSSRRYLEKRDEERARRCEELNYVLHNSYVPARLALRGEVTFAYGGIGVIVHPDADIFTGVTIGANVTIGGNGSQRRTDERTKTSSTVPQLREYVTIGACANISGGIEIGAMSIIAPNSVVTKSVAPGHIVAGAPARTIGAVTQENAIRYKAKYLPLRRISDERFLEIAAENLPSTN